MHYMIRNYKGQVIPSCAIAKIFTQHPMLLAKIYYNIQYTYYTLFPRFPSVCYTLSCCSQWTYRGLNFGIWEHLESNLTFFCKLRSKVKVNVLLYNTSIMREPVARPGAQPKQKDKVKFSR